MRPKAAPNTTGTVSGSHVYADNGIYSVKVTVTDDDGGVGSATIGSRAAMATTCCSGGLGDDLLIGRSGRDLLIGGQGADRIIGNADDDILIAGFTLFDYDYQQRAAGMLRRDHEEAISQIMQKWTSTDDSMDRIRALNDTAFPYRLRAGETVLEDTDRDTLTGSADDDWFLFAPDKDRATDLVDEVLGSDLDWVRAG